MIERGASSFHSAPCSSLITHSSVHLVHGNYTTRRKSRLYKFNMSLMLGWVAVFILLSASQPRACPLDVSQAERDLTGLPQHRDPPIRQLLCDYRLSNIQLVFSFDPMQERGLIGPAASLGVSVDLAVDCFLSFLFIIPLWRGDFKSPQLRRVAVRSLIAASISMASSVTNLGLFSGLHGRELSFICLTACTLDTVVNATSLFMVRIPNFIGSKHFT